MKKAKIGLALGGGSVLGAAHVGVLKAIEELEIKIDYISGTSIGSFISSLYAFGYKGEDIEEIIIDLNWVDISKVSLSKYGLLTNEKLANIIKKHIGEKRIEDAKIPLSIIATDIETGEKVVFQKGNLGKSIRASTCIPGIFTPIRMDNKLLVDGGVVENVPVTPLKEQGAETIIAVDLLAKYSKDNPKNIIDVLQNTFNYMILHSSQTESAQADILIEPILSSFNKISTKQIKKLVDKGFHEAKRQLQKIET